LVREFPQRLEQRVVSMDRGRERRVALILESRETREVQVVGSAVRLLERRAPRDHERDPGDAVQALVGGGRYCRETRVAEIQCLRAEAADTIQEQPEPMRPAQLAQPPQIVEPSGSGLMMNDRQVRAAP